VQEAKLRGPHPFPLERLLNICWALLDADAAASDEAPPLDGVERQSAEAFMQISSLVSLQLLSQARCCLLALSLAIVILVGQRSWLTAIYRTVTASAFVIGLRVVCLC